MQPIVLLLAASLLFIECNGGSYFISAPRTVVPGTQLDLSVDIVQPNLTDVPITVTLQHYEYYSPSGSPGPRQIKSVTGNFSYGVSGTLSIPVDLDINCPNCQLLIRGHNPLQFETTLGVQISTDIVTILIQTDKAIYKAKERVNFRILAVYSNLQLYNGTFHYEIKDPSGSKINVFNGLQSTFGVVERYFDLSDQPAFGTWIISASTENVFATVMQTFEVSDYDLPRFEVKVELPPFGLLSDSILTGSVEAKYTFGQPVNALVELQIGENVDSTGGCDINRKITEITFTIDGKGNFSIALEDIQRSVPLYDNRQVRVTAFVTETSTGVKLNGSSVITYYENKYQVKVLDVTPNVFKPGLQYTAFIQVSTPDGLPPTDSNLTVSVYTAVTYQLTVPDQALYPSLDFRGSYPLPGQNLTLPSNGVLPVDIDIPSNATSIDIKVSLNKQSVNKQVQKTYSKSNNYLQLSLLNNNITAGQEIEIKITGTETINNLVYEIRSRSSTVDSGTLELNGQREFIHTLQVTPAMAPTAQLLMYYVRDSEEIVADSLAFNVDGIFNNKVSVAFVEEESDVNKNVSVKLTADPDSQVFLLAVDQSVLLLKTGNDITPKKVKETLSSKFNKGKSPPDSENALAYSAKSISEVFSNMDLNIATDLNIAVPYFPEYQNYGYMRGGGGVGGGYGGYAMDSYMAAPQAMTLMSSKYEPLEKSSTAKPIDRVRSIFPETWLWTSIKSVDGQAVVTATVPDTITSWIVSAFATNLNTGLGVALTTAKLRVFRPFFVSLTYPRSVTRNEEFVVQATVFNYLPAELSVKVTLEYSSGSASGPQMFTVQVKSNEQGVVYFPLSAPVAGLCEIKVIAASEVAWDALVRQILVKYEGAPVIYNYPQFISLSSNQSVFESNVANSLPESVVQGSQRIKAKLTGDLIGLSLESLASLLTLPTGCGEQSLVKFTPSIYIGRYLKASGQLTKDLEKTITDMLSDGYQRQLVYRRYDFGFSAFGNYDLSSSTWLTALVVKSFVEAQEFIYVDPEVILKSAKWLVDKQNLDGSFSEFGKVIDRNTQGTSSGPALTAFVLMALMKAQELTNVTQCLDIQYVVCPYYILGNATLKAKRNLENLVLAGSIDNQFSLAVTSFALAEAKSTLAAEAALNKLLTFALNEGSLQYWSDNSTVEVTSPNTAPRWRPPHVQARPIDILITSYAILTYTSLDRFDEALPSVRWLISQRNAQGGFVSTQDTIVGLQALSSFASQSFRPDTNITVTVSDITPILNMNVDSNNALSLQIQEVQHTGRDFSISAYGIGMALLDFEYSFNVLEELSTPAYDVNIVLLDDKLDSFNLMICTKQLFKHDTGMVVQEVSIPSGFVPDLTTLGKVAGIKRSERKGPVVAVYFDKISRSSLCYSIVMIRESKVAKSQKSYVRTYDYYEPANQATVFYHPKAIRDSTICDVCPSLCP